jgi:hypothetical protein
MKIPSTDRAVTESRQVIKTTARSPLPKDQKAHETFLHYPTKSDLALNPSVAESTALQLPKLHTAFLFRPQFLADNFFAQTSSAMPRNLNSSALL